MAGRQAVAKVTSKGQATIPIEIRRYLGIHEGDRIEFTIGSDGCVQMQRVEYPTLASLRGAAGSLAKPKSWEEIERSAREERVEAILRDK